MELSRSSREHFDENTRPPTFFMIIAICRDKNGNELAKVSTMKVSPMLLPYSALEEVVKVLAHDAKTKINKPHNATVTITNDKYLPNGVFVVEFLD